MNNTTKFLIGLVVVAFVAGFVGYFAGNTSGTNNVLHQLGATTSTYNTALQQIPLYNWQVDVVNSLAALRAPLSGVTASTTASITFPAVSSTTTQGTTTVITGLAASNGDFIFVSPNTPTAGVNFYGGVNTASTTSATFQISAVNASTSAATVTPTATTFNVTVVPKSSFTAPAALSVTTSSAPYNP